MSATEDRVVGSLDLESALTTGERRFHPGLLADADNGVLYIDEINLLPDHLVDVLLDVAASGVNRVERESMSESHPSRFVLIGSMNPEEGELRPQLLDRFGLAVDVVSSPDPAERVEAVQRRMAFDARPRRVRREPGRRTMRRWPSGWPAPPRERFRPISFSASANSASPWDAKGSGPIW